MVVKALLDRASDLDPASGDDMRFGDASGAGQENRNVARMAVPLPRSARLAARGQAPRCRHSPLTYCIAR